jgi:hypothetical protein
MRDNFFNINWVDQHKNLEYKIDYFKDAETLKLWQDSGIDKTQTKIYLHQIKKPYVWMFDLINQVNNFFNISNCSYAFHKITPGNFLLMHSDKFDFFKKKFNIQEIHKIQRIIIFLEKGDPGHILIVNDKCFMNWKRGEYASWIGGTPHLAANLGTTDRYTLQITGIVND